jgi:hypothetical protein
MIQKDIMIEHRNYRYYPCSSSRVYRVFVVVVVVRPPYGWFHLDAVRKIMFFFIFIFVDVRRGMTCCCRDGMIWVLPCLSSAGGGRRRRGSLALARAAGAGAGTASLLLLLARGSVGQAVARDHDDEDDELYSRTHQKIENLKLDVLRIS